MTLGAQVIGHFVGGLFVSKDDGVLAVESIGRLDLVTLHDTT